jgi:hypothetical protein
MRTYPATDPRTRRRCIAARFAGAAVALAAMLPMAYANDAGSPDKPKGNPMVLVVSADPPKSFKLDSVHVLVNGEEVASQTYADGTLRISGPRSVLVHWSEEVAEGGHEVVAFVTGVDQENRPLKQRARAKVHKGPNIKYVEFKITYGKDDDHPQFQLEEW